jgi:hypothetical protein
VVLTADKAQREAMWVLTSYRHREKLCDFDCLQVQRVAMWILLLTGTDRSYVVLTVDRHREKLCGFDHL